MAIEQRSDNAAIEHSRESLVLRFRVELADELFALWKTVYPQAFFVRRAAAETNTVR